MNLIDRTRAYFRASKDELMAVTWPTRQDITRYTGLVVAIVIIFGIFFSALDFVVNAGIQAIIARKTSTATSQTASSTAPATTPVDVNPVDVEAVTPTGAPADIKVEQVPVNPTPASTSTPAQN